MIQGAEEQHHAAHSLHPIGTRSFGGALALSTTGLPSAVPTVHALIQFDVLTLDGFILGSDRALGTVHLLKSTTGTLAPLGTVSLTGYLIIPLKAGANRSVHGIVKMSNSQGSITVCLRGTVTVYKSPFPFASGNLTYRIVSGARAYHSATGTGPVLYGPGPVFLPGRFLLDFGNAIPPP